LQVCAGRHAGLSGNPQSQTGWLRYVQTGKSDLYLEQVAVQIDFKRSLLQRRQVLCNRQSQSQAAKLLSGSRLQIVFLLKKEPMSEKQLAGYMDEDEQGVGAELCVLQAVGLVSAEKEGTAAIVVSADEKPGGMEDLSDTDAIRDASGESPSDRRCSFPFDRARRGAAAAVQGTGTFWTFV